MPDVCPHCGERLPAVVDAYCPECRGDLAPESPTDAGQSLNHTAAERRAMPRGVLWCGFLALVAFAWGIVHAVRGDREQATQAVLLAAPVWALFAAWAYWNPFTRHKLDGESRARNTK